MYKNLLSIGDTCALYEIIEDIPLDEAGMFTTSYDIEDIISVDRLGRDEVRVRYTHLQPVLDKTE